MRLTVLGAAKKQLKRLSKLKQMIVVQKLRMLAGGEEVSNVEMLTGYKNVYRVRVGDYRVIYKKTADEVTIIMVGHRKEVYKLLERLLG